MRVPGGKHLGDVGLVHIAQDLCQLLQGQVRVQQIVGSLADAHFVEQVEKGQARHGGDPGADGGPAAPEHIRQLLERQLLAAVQVHVPQQLPVVGPLSVGGTVCRQGLSGKQHRQLHQQTHGIETGKQLSLLLKGRKTQLPGQAVSNVSGLRPLPGGQLQHRHRLHQPGHGHGLAILAPEQMGSPGHGIKVIGHEAVGDGLVHPGDLADLPGQDSRQRPGGQRILPALEPQDAAAAAHQEKTGVPVDHRGRGPGSGKLVIGKQAALVQLGAARRLQGNGLLHGNSPFMGAIVPRRVCLAKR